MSYHVRFEDLGLRDYKEVWDYQEGLMRSVIKAREAYDTTSRDGCQSDLPTLIFVEHPHVYTLGKSGSDNNMLIDHIQLKANNASFYHINRGGDITYHGPGQIVGYPIFDLSVLGIGLREYIYNLEESIILTLKEYGVEASRLDGAVGVWIGADGPSPRKICAIGVRVSRSVTMHGFAFNINTNLDYFNYINPCGFTDKGVTSLSVELKSDIDINEVKSRLSRTLAAVFELNYL